MSTVDESLAKALGWERCHDRNVRTMSGHAPCETGWMRGAEHVEPPPKWSTSFDACLRDIVPVLEARNLAWMIAHGGTGGRYSCAVYPRGDDPGEMITAFGETVPAAFCEAALKAPWTMSGDSLEAAYARIGGAAMDAKQDDAMAHVAHAFGCQTCIDHGNENLRLAVQLQKLRKRNRKLKKRLRDALRSP